MTPERLHDPHREDTRDHRQGNHQTGTEDRQDGEIQELLRKNEDIPDLDLKVRVVVHGLQGEVNRGLYPDHVRLILEKILEVLEGTDRDLHQQEEAHTKEEDQMKKGARVHRE